MVMSPRILRDDGTVGISFTVLTETAGDEEIRLVGNVSMLGQWDPDAALEMQKIDEQTWFRDLSSIVLTNCLTTVVLKKEESPEPDIGPL